jgi:hypothetical protein
MHRKVQYKHDLKLYVVINVGRVLFFEKEFSDFCFDSTSKNSFYLIRSVLLPMHVVSHNHKRLLLYQHDVLFERLLLKL